MLGPISLSQALVSKISEKTATVYIVPIGNNGDPEQGLAFQYFPETISDTKAVNWNSREVPGGALPIYQWISSGERVISFTAVFTCDNDLINPNKGGQDLVDRLKANGQESRNIDIRAAICWLRSFMLPTYGNVSAVGTVIPKAPKKLLIGIPNTQLGAMGGSQRWGIDEVLCFMQTCDVTFEAFFPSGLPRVASVSLSFVQMAQFEREIEFPSAKLAVDSYQGNEQCFGYKLEKRTYAKGPKG